MADRDEKGHFLPGHAPTAGGGRPKGRSFTDHLKAAFADIPTPMAIARLCDVYNVPEDMRAQLELCGSVSEALAQLMTWRALAGDLDAWKEIGDRLTPKPRRLEISGRDGGPIATVAAGVDPADAASRYYAAMAEESEE